MCELGFGARFGFAFGFSLKADFWFQFQSWFYNSVFQILKSTSQIIHNQNNQPDNWNQNQTQTPTPPNQKSTNLPTFKFGVIYLSSSLTNINSNLKLLNQSTWSMITRLLKNLPLFSSSHYPSPLSIGMH